MTLPRFTSGNVGNLRFSHLNDAFGYIDLERGSDETPSMPATDPKLPLVVAKITGTSGNKASWKEQTYNAATSSWVDLPGGRTSAAPGDDFRYGARSLALSQMASGSIVILVPKREKDGDAYYLAQESSQSSTGVYKISSSSSAVSNQRWFYKVRKQLPLPVPTGGFVEADPTELDMVNSVESVSDSPPNLFGVGFKPPPAQLVRKPLRGGLVVTATVIDGVLVCCVPNGYEVVCGP